ncbi:MAG: SEC-C metal-binding domain-containing protein [Nitrospirota bacterium]
MMTKIGRNEKCPCGSNKKYKNCCGFINPINEDMVGHVFYDHEELKKYVLTKDILINQLKREGKKITDSFDKVCSNDIKEISELYCNAYGIIHEGINNTKDKEKLTAGVLLLNALSTHFTAIQALRNGFLLQPGILIRHIIESVSTVLYLMQDEKGLEQLENGKLDSTKTINWAKKVFPFFGKIYGLFSNNFAHIGKFHTYFNPILEYTEKSEGLTANIGFLKSSLWLIFVTAEVTFYSNISVHRYWKKLDERAYAYQPSNEGLRWFKQFFKDIIKE